MSRTTLYTVTPAGTLKDFAEYRNAYGSAAAVWGVARWARRDAIGPLTAAEKWTVRIAVAESMARWLREEEPEDGPEQYMAEALEHARAHVAANMHLVTEDR